MNTMPAVAALMELKRGCIFASIKAYIAGQVLAAYRSLRGAAIVYLLEDQAP